MTFDPAKINLQQLQYQCEHGGRRSVCVKTEVCFNFIIRSEKMKSPFTTGGPTPIPSSITKKISIRCCCVLIFPLILSGHHAEIRYSLKVDALRAKARASFIDLGDKSDSRIFSIRDRESKCVQETFMMSVSALIFERTTWEFSHGVLPAENVTAKPYRARRVPPCPLRFVFRSCAQSISAMKETCLAPCWQPK